jgi:hypothetical protein
MKSRQRIAFEAARKVADDAARRAYRILEKKGINAAAPALRVAAFRKLLVAAMPSAGSRASRRREAAAIFLRAGDVDGARAIWESVPVAQRGLHFHSEAAATDFDVWRAEYERMVGKFATGCTCSASS